MESATQQSEKLPTYEELQNLVKDKDRQISILTHQILELKRYVFGRRSEKLESDLQESLFPDRQPQTSELSEQEEEIEVNSYKRSKRNGRKKLPEDLPIDRIEYEPEIQTCSSCGSDLSKIGEEITEQIDYIPASFVKRHLVRIKRACSCCKDKVVKGEIPAEKQVFDRCKAAPGLVSHIIVSKYCDHLPLNRQEQIFARVGIDISRKTMCDWVARSA